MIGGRHRGIRHWGSAESAAGGAGAAVLVALALAGALAPAAGATQGDTVLVSRQSAAAGGNGADDRSFSQSISRSGRFIAFATPATNLGGPIVAPLNVYAYDSKQKGTALASRASGGGAGADAGSSEPAIAGAGRFVGFISTATNLDPAAYTGGIPTPSSVYRHQLRP